MIGRKERISENQEDVGPKGFDDYDLRLGDVMRGERATMGKSLLDVQRELRIRAAYIAAIENCDPSAFETPGFIAGYVRSYARYLGLDADDCFADFCRESGFTTAHGMSAAASTIRKPEAAIAATGEHDPFLRPDTPFAPVQDSILSRIEPRAIGSMLVLLALIGGIGYGGWSVLREVQRVSLAPVDQSPMVLAELDPLETAMASSAQQDQDENAVESAGVFSPPADALDRLYRPQALDVPVLVARDGPISTLDPSAVGSFMPREPAMTSIASSEPIPATVPQVVEEAAPDMVMFAVRPAWVRVRAADGTVIFEKILDAGEEYVLPASEEPPTLRAGMSGSIYFKLDGDLYGPAGQGTNTVRELALDANGLREKYDVADLESDPELARIVAIAAAQGVVQGDGN
ncbi:protein RodZ, contains Xre-like HTH and DUF4115 domains [Salinihabitans flavidus]|uniref:Protein RodZ, contains Xre-like HTH and DUF4115 domains n=1 Tax=Salinihabitans flavidus TaxID=569882 RepID=A0A1H8RSB4_9RHOB|nr:helix-turn-helix domain-containing protein [Salinihabitans flavidus]SEO69361.1 protein RodZ, contains Xre-like HTH and DUF4115 domains [Salinihabitans flavidus]